MSKENTETFHVVPHVSRKSVVFNYFGPLYYGGSEVDNTHVYCRLCCQRIVDKHKGKIANQPNQDYSAFFRYKVSVSTSSLHTHLYNGHQIDTRKQTELSESTSSLKSFFKIAKPGQEIAYVNGLAKDMFLWLSHSLLPFRVVEDEGTKLFLAKYTKIPLEKIPGRKAVTRVGREVYNSIKNVVKERLASDDHLSGSTTFDIWTDKHAKKSYIGLTYHYIDADYKLCKVLLAANVFPHPHNYSAIGDWVTGVFNDYDLQRSRIHVTDSASNNLKFSREYDEIRLSCDSHALHHLISTDAVKKNKEATDLVTKVKKIVTTLVWRKDSVKQSHEDRIVANKLQIQSKVEEVQKVLTMDDQFAIGIHEVETSTSAKKLAQEVPTRWTSLFALLTTVYHSYSSIKHELIEMNSIDLFLLQSEINLLGELVKFLSCFDTWTKSIQSDYVSLSNAVLMREQLYELVTSSNNDHAVVQDLKRKMHANWDCRIPSLGIHYLAALLDPSLKKLKSLKDYLSSYDGTVLDFVSRMLRDLGLKMSDLYKPAQGEKSVDDSVRTPPDQPTEDQDNEVQIVHPATAEITLKRSLTKKEEKELNVKRKRLDLIKRFSSVGVNNWSESSCLNVELVNYMNSEDLIDEDFDLLEYWRNKKSCFPGLSRLARITHSIPATSSEIERVWSLSGLIISARRSSIDPQNYKHLIYARYNWDIVKSAVSE